MYSRRPTPKQIQNLNMQDLKDFLARWERPDNSILGISGDQPPCGHLLNLVVLPHYRSQFESWYTVGFILNIVTTLHGTSQLVATSKRFTATICMSEIQLPVNSRSVTSLLAVMGSTSVAFSHFAGIRFCSTYQHTAIDQHSYVLAPRSISCGLCNVSPLYCKPYLLPALYLHGCTTQPLNYITCSNAFLLRQLSVSSCVWMLQVATAFRIAAIKQRASILAVGSHLLIAVYKNLQQLLLPLRLD